MGQVIEQIKKLWAGLKEFWAKQSKKNKILIIIGLVVLVALIALLVVWMNQTKYSILYSGLDADERIEVEEYLNESGIEYKAEGDTLYVDELSEESVRMELSNLGHPYSTPSYDFYFENVGTLTTSEERELIEEYQLNQRLADVIKTIDGVESATVTIAYPPNSNYVLSESDEEVTAGVTVTLGAGVNLTQTQVNGIVTLVSTSVPGLTAENVSVLNTATGETLVATDDSKSPASADAYALKLDVENLYEDEIQGKVLSVLQPIYGVNNVRVSVKSSIDINDSVKEIMTYFPSEDNKGVISSEDLAYAIQNEGGTVAGVPGTDSNAELPEGDDASNDVTEDEDITTYPSVTVDGDTIYLQDEKSYDYLVSYVKEQVQKTAGEVEGLTVSVILNRETISDSKRQELTNLIANAAAIEDEHVVVYTDLFDTSGQTIVDDIVSPFEQYPWLIYVVIIGAALLIILIAVIIILVKRKKKKKKAEEEAAAAAAAAAEAAEQGELSLDADQMEELQDIKIAKGLVMKQKIQDFSKENPEIAAQLVKAWLRGEDN